MKQIILIPLLLVAALIHAQKQNRVEAHIRELEDRSVSAILKGDTMMLKELWAPEFMVNTPRNDVAVNRDSVLSIQSRGLIDYLSFTRVVEKVQVQKKVVITMGSETYVPRQTGETIRRRFINIWMKKKGEWKHVARQASVICEK